MYKCLSEVVLAYTKEQYQVYQARLKVFLALNPLPKGVKCGYLRKSVWVGQASSDVLPASCDLWL